MEFPMTVVALSNKFTVFSDAGHAWAQVELSDLYDVGLSLQQITAYSFIQGTTLYLEEDADLTLFVAAYRAKYGTDPILVSRKPVKAQSFVRKLQRINGADSSFERQNELVKFFNGVFAKKYPQAA
jgi:hypothetical protein